MLHVNQVECYKLIYSLDHVIDWRKIARASKQCGAEEVAQEAFLWRTESEVEQFDVSNNEHWNELKRSMRNKFVYDADRTLKYAPGLEEASRYGADEAIHPVLLGLPAPRFQVPL